MDPEKTKEILRNLPEPKPMVEAPHGSAMSSSIIHSDGSMRIPLALKTCRYYVATSSEKAFSSWDNLDDAIDGRNRLSDEERNSVIGIIKVTPSGRSLVA